MHIPTILDITNFRQTDQLKLREAIFDAVKDTQIGFMRTLPDEIHMTEPQYILLQNDKEMIQVQKERLYYTPLNCMEVKVL